MHRNLAPGVAIGGVGLVALLVVAIVGLASTAPAQADCGLGPPFTLDLGRHPRLAPTVPATERLDCADIGDGKEYDYAVRGYFKIRRRTVARLAELTGHADARPEHLRLVIPADTRRTIRAAARDSGARRVTLTLVYRLAQTAGPGSWAGRPYGQDAFLAIRSSP